MSNEVGGASFIATDSSTRESQRPARTVDDGRRTPSPVPGRQRSAGLRLTGGLISAALALSFPLAADAEDGIIGPPACGYKVEYWVAPNCGGATSLSFATAVNDAGVAVGYYEGCPSPNAHRAFVWYPDGTVQTIDIPWSISEQACGVNNHTQIAFEVDAPGATLARVPALWQDGELLEVFGLPEWANNAFVHGINDAGVIVAEYGNIVTGPAPLAGVWSVQDGFVDVSARIPTASSQPCGITAAGAIAGTGWPHQPLPVQEHYRAFMHQNGVTAFAEAVPGCINSIANGVSSAGHVVGYGQTSLYVKGETDTHPWIAFIWHLGDLQVLPPLAIADHDETIASAVNSSGVVIGRSSSTAPGVPGKRVVWFGGIPHDLTALSHLPSNSSIGTSRAISDTGIIVGNGGHQGAPRAMRLTPIRRPLADLDHDCLVDGSDLSALLSSWGTVSHHQNRPHPADLNSDGAVDGEDLGLLLAEWSTR
ncbi:MAG TPA: hypothetical protein PKC43_14990 [Phycisphaerales bacterium]|nr:hypothetical protein [Phycisphaerales bacterium]HMP38739.1 hypothetical protein [Phycisphaerales bacterium]